MGPIRGGVPASYYGLVQIPFAWEESRRALTVTELTETIRATLAAEFTGIWVAGEISGVKTGPSGHIYFTLKDSGAQVRCALFARTARIVRFKPQDGVEVLLSGRIDVYAPRGEYQFLVDSIEARGLGALQAAFDLLKKKLAAEGLFDAARKRSLPPFPRRIGIVTSPTGAVIRDMINILTRRFPGLHIRLYPSMVQGEGSAEQVCRGIQSFSAGGWAEVVIVARGGGSIEDLWTFNEESVARAIAACSMPVISAIGHETDFTIADFVADLRAPTPSAAAELVVSSRLQIAEKLDSLDRHLLQNARYRIAMVTQKLHQLETGRAAASLHRFIGRAFQQVDDAGNRMRDAVRARMEHSHRSLLGLDARLRVLDLRLRMAEGRRRLQASQSRLEERGRWTLSQARRGFEPVVAQLEQLSPLRVLDRGYAIVQDEKGAVVKESLQAPAGTQVNIRLAKGRIAARVEPAS
ncbi:MAG: exodeoxyribonuclease VII large subunit [Candidatus Solibacter usitatus]|nr:exodeoxyribonuclease VII large subunit [Candidatus Solibacter usitatus]